MNHVDYPFFLPLAKKEDINLKQYTFAVVPGKLVSESDLHNVIIAEIKSRGSAVFDFPSRRSPRE